MSHAPPHTSFPSSRLKGPMPDSPRKSSPTRRVVLSELTPNARASRRPTTSDEEPFKTPAQAASSPLKRPRPVTPTEVLSAKRRRELSEERQTDPHVAGKQKTPKDATDAIDGAGKRPREDNVQPSEPHAILLEGLDRSSTEADTPEPAVRDALNEEVLLPPAADNAAAKGSFSSLIDYDPSLASDKSHTPSVSSAAEERGEPFEVSIKSQVDALRLRLRVAMYKVRTGQTALPMSQLKVESQKQEKAGDGGEVGPAAQEHAADGAPRTKSLGLLPAPVLKPTAYSSRFVRETAGPVHLSPPSHSASPLKDVMLAGSTAGLPQPATRVSSPLKPSAHLTPLGRKMLESEDNLTSSAVKGRAADGLLELMRAT